MEIKDNLEKMVLLDLLAQPEPKDIQVKMEAMVNQVIMDTLEIKEKKVILAQMDIQDHREKMVIKDQKDMMDLKDLQDQKVLVDLLDQCNLLLVTEPQDMEHHHTHHHHQQTFMIFFQNQDYFEGMIQ